METLFFYGHKEVLLRRLIKRTRLKCGKGDGDHMMGSTQNRLGAIRKSQRPTPHCFGFMWGNMTKFYPIETFATNYIHGCLFTNPWI